MPTPPIPLFDADPTGGVLYQACRDHESKRDIREKLERSWEQHWQRCPEKPKQFVKEFRKNFHSRSWELFLLSVLADAGLTLERTQAKGPDICVRLASGKRCWIEAVAPTPGTEDNAVFQRPEGNWRGILPKDNNLILRYRTGLEAKLNKLDQYKASGIVGPDDAYVVALYPGDIVDSDLYDMELPALARAVFPIGETVLKVPVYRDGPMTLETPVRENVTKVNKQRTVSTVSTRFFLEPRTEFISGVLFVGQTIYNISWSAAESLHMIHRPNAKVPLPNGTIPSRCELWLEPDGTLGHLGKCAQFGSFAEDVP